MSEVVTLITQLGFPIAMCLLLCYYIKYTNDQHREEVDRLREVVERNTLALQKLADKLGGDPDNVDDCK